MVEINRSWIVGDGDVNGDVSDGLVAVRVDGGWQGEEPEGPLLSLRLETGASEASSVGYEQGSLGGNFGGDRLD